MIDLSTSYMGLRLGSPLVASSSPLAKDLSNLRKLEEAGASAVVLHSLFEEQILLEGERVDRMLSMNSNRSAEASSYFPELSSYNIGPDAYLTHIRKAKDALGIPVIASLNGVSTGGWIRYARQIEQAGADALELNIYYLPTDMEQSGSAIEQSYCDLVDDMKDQLSIPLAVKLSPFFTSIANLCYRLDIARADGLVLFNRFYQPDFDIEALNVTPNLALSTPAELRLRLHWVAMLSHRLRPDLAVTGGVHEATDVLKSVMAGAKVVMMTSALLAHGIAHLGKVRRDMIEWMEKREYISIAEMWGAMNAESVAEPAVFERANYMKVLGSFH